MISLPASSPRVVSRDEEEEELPAPVSRAQFDGLATLIDELPMANSSRHGRDHWMHEAWAGLELADRDERVDRGLVLLFAMLHDTHRQNEGQDPDHGQRAADFATGINDSVLRLSPERLELLTKACVLHDRGLVTADPTIGACWDADRLQLNRVGITPDPGYLSTAPAPGLVEKATALLGFEMSWEAVYRRYAGERPELRGRWLMLRVAAELEHMSDAEKRAFPAMAAAEGHTVEQLVESLALIADHWADLVRAHPGLEGFVESISAEAEPGSEQFHRLFLSTFPDLPARPLAWTDEDLIYGALKCTLDRASIMALGVLRMANL